VLPEHLPEALQHTRASGPARELREGFSLDAHLLSMERALLREALEQARGERLAASRLLGISPRSLRYLMAKHQIDEAAAKN
jgi:DNA-binding NtrC family response regulator